MANTYIRKTSNWNCYMPRIIEQSKKFLRHRIHQFFLFCWIELVLLTDLSKFKKIRIWIGNFHLIQTKSSCYEIIPMIVIKVSCILLCTVVIPKAWDYYYQSNAKSLQVSIKLVLNFASCSCVLNYNRLQMVQYLVNNKNSDNKNINLKA